MKQALLGTVGGLLAMTGVLTVPATAAETKSPTSSVLLATRTTDYHHASKSQCKNIELVAKRLNGVVIPPHATFSYYRTVGPYTAENGYHWGRAFSGDRIVPSMGGGVCQGASTLYSAVMRTDLKVVERYQHSLTVPYLPPGEDATVTGTVKNFRFTNTHSTPIRLAASADSSVRKMTVSIYGTEPGPEVTVHHKTLSTTPFPVRKRLNEELPEGETKVLFPGQNGVKVKTWVVTKWPDGHTTTKDFGIDTYRPSPRIIEYND